LQVVPGQAHGLLFFQAGITPAGRVPGVPVSGAKAGAGLSYFDLKIPGPWALITACWEGG